MQLTARQACGTLAAMAALASGHGAQGPGALRIRSLSFAVWMEAPAESPSSAIFRMRPALSKIFFISCSWGYCSSWRTGVGAYG